MEEASEKIEAISANSSIVMRGWVNQGGFRGRGAKRRGCRRLRRVILVLPFVSAPAPSSSEVSGGGRRGAVRGFRSIHHP